VRKLIPRKLIELPTQWLLLPIALVALAISGLFGGLRPAEQSDVDTAAVGQHIDGQPWNATVVSARLARSTDDLPTQGTANHWIVVRISLLVTGDEPVSVRDTVRMRGASGLVSATPAMAVLLRDGRDVPELNPGLPETFDFYWEQKPQPAAPKSVLVDVFNEIQRENSFTGQLIWADPEVKATVTVPVSGAAS